MEMEDTSSQTRGKNQKIVILGVAELGMASILLIYGAIFIILSLFHVHTHTELYAIPGLGFFLSLGWIFVSRKLIQSAEKCRDIRQRRRYVLFWTCYSVFLSLFNVGVIILFVTVLLVKHDDYYYYHIINLVTAAIISFVVLLVRGFIFFTVFLYSKELLVETKSPKTETAEEGEHIRALNSENGSTKGVEHDTNRNKYENSSQNEEQETRTVLVTAV